MFADFFTHLIIGIQYDIYNEILIYSTGAMIQRLWFQKGSSTPRKFTTLKRCIFKYLFNTSIKVSKLCISIYCLDPYNLLIQLSKFPRYCSVHNIFNLWYVELLAQINPSLSQISLKLPNWQLPLVHGNHDNHGNHHYVQISQ
jgi:hypothetical protein